MLLPILLNWTVNGQYNQVFESMDDYFYVLSMSIILSIPTILGTLTATFRKQIDGEFSLYLEYAELNLLFMQDITTVMMYIILSYGNLHSKTVWIYFLIQLRLIGVIATVVSFMTRIGQPFFGQKSSVIAVFFIATGRIIRFYELFIGYNSSLTITHSVIQTVGLIIILFQASRWIYIRYTSLDMDSFTRDRNLDSVYSISLLIIGLGTWILMFMYEITDYSSYDMGYFYTEVAIQSSIALLLPIFLYRSFHTQLRSTHDLIEVKRMFIGYISHELRTPLNAVATGLQLLEREMVVAENDEYLDTVKDLQESCTSAVDVLEDMLVSDQIESGELELGHEDIGIQQLLQDAKEYFNKQAQESGIDLSIDYQGYQTELSNYVITGDRVKLLRAAKHLISNGIKFNSEGGAVRVLVHLVIDAAGEEEESLRWLRIDVVDSGQGMTQEVVDGLFSGSIHFRPGTIRLGQGTGLGLFIAKGIFAAHEGRISGISSGIGQGSTFTVELPLHPVGVDGIEPQPSAEGFLDYYNQDQRAMLLIRNPSSSRGGTSSLLVGSTSGNRGVSSSNSNTTSSRPSRSSSSSGPSRRAALSMYSSAAASYPSSSSSSSSGPNARVAEALFRRNPHNNPLVANLSIRTPSSNGTSSHLVGSIIRRNSVSSAMNMNTSSRYSAAMSASFRRHMSSSNLIEKPTESSFNRRTSFLDSFYESVQPGSRKMSSIAPDELAEEISVRPIPTIGVSVVGRREHPDISNVDALKVGLVPFGKVDVSGDDIDVGLKTTGLELTDEKEGAGSSSAKPSPRRRKPRILVVDDARSNRRVICKVLESRCESLDEAEDGQEAVDKVRASMNGESAYRFDLITMDYQMPKLDGPTATKMIRELGFTGMIIGVTGNVLLKDVHHFKALGANMVLAKPLNISLLERAISEANLED